MAKRRIRLEVEIDVTIDEGVLEIYKEEGVCEDDAFDTVIQGLDIDVSTTDEACVEVGCWVEK